MTREEMLELRSKVQSRFEERKRLGDFDASAAAVRESLECNLKILDHLIQRTPKGK